MLTLAYTMRETDHDEEPGAVPLSPQEERSLSSIFGTYQDEVVTPFFALPPAELAQADELWSRWSEGLRPSVRDLQAQVKGRFEDEQGFRIYRSRFDMILEGAAEPLAKISTESAMTFASALSSAWTSDNAFLTLTSWRSPEELKLNPGLWNRREHASVGFGLAFLLTIETLTRAPEERERISYLVLKMKRSSALLWSTTQQILKAVRP